jgi:TM2 domain-containing membrane protein YozV
MGLAVPARGSAAVACLGAALLALAAARFARAQDTPTGTEAPPSVGLPAGSTLYIQSEPPGAVVVLRGPYEWVGVTPWRLSREVSGLYHVEARLPGYDTWKSDVIFGAMGGQQLHITLGRKTTTKALLRSLFIPGWGQIYRGSRGKGWLVLTGAAIAGGAFFVTDDAYRSAVDDFDAARDRYEEATRLEDLDDRWAEVRSASREADRRWDRRRIAWGALAGVYTFNLLDVLFFAPSGAAETSSISGLDPAAEPDGGLGWSASADPQGSVRAALSWNW